MPSGSIRLFRFAGIQVFLHFSWFLVAAYQVQSRLHAYRSPIWAIYEYLALFGIVLVHEFGHALACRQVGGVANQIVLWPLGGIAFVSPPSRAGAMLWSIAAGPLVNVVLIPIFGLLMFLARQNGWMYSAPDLFAFLRSIQFINTALLVFNILPIYPLDGGQILRALLWFPFGQIASLRIASALGLVGGALLAGAALWFQWVDPIWGAVLGFFLLSRAIGGWQQANALAAEVAAAKEMRTEPPPPAA